MRFPWHCPSTSVRFSMPAKPWVVRVASRLSSLAKLRHRVPTHGQSRLLLFRKGMCPLLRSYLHLCLRPFQLLHLHLSLPLSLRPRPRQPLLQTRVLAPVGLSIDRKTSRFKTHLQTTMEFTTHLRTMKEISRPIRTGQTDRMGSGIKTPNELFNKSSNMDISAT